MDKPDVKSLAGQYLDLWQDHMIECLSLCLPLLPSWDESAREKESIVDDGLSGTSADIPQS